MNGKVERIYDDVKMKEVAVASNGFRYDCVYGRKNGGMMLAVTNMNVCCNLTEFTDINTKYNIVKLFEVINDYEIAEAIIETITKYEEGIYE